MEYKNRTLLLELVIQKLQRLTDKELQETYNRVAAERANMSSYSSIYRTVFDFHKKWTPSPESLEKWQECAAEATEIASRETGNAFLQDMLTAVYKEIERNGKSRTA